MIASIVLRNDATIYREKPLLIRLITFHREKTLLIDSIRRFSGKIANYDLKKQP